MIIFPDVEKLARSYLLESLAAQGNAQPVSTGVPNPRPERFVRVIVNPGADTSLVTSKVQVIVQCYDVDEVRAGDTARLVAALMKAAPGRRIDGYPHVHRAEKIGGPTRLDDPDLESVARYQVVVNWSIRATH